jgi:phosphoribosylformylglycinamidine synthase subunit PurQ / glutaminase
LTDSSGRVLGLMPHPERHVRPTQHPRWSRHELRTTEHEPQTADGMTIFNNAIKYIRQNF